MNPTTVFYKQDDDISPEFEGSNPVESEIAKRLMKLDKTPEAIREFCRCRNKLRDYQYWFLLGTLWVSYTGFSDLQLWKKLFSSDRPKRERSLMKPSEYRALRGMPEHFTVYRAHRPGETDWIAYTLNLAVAMRLAAERKVDEVAVYTVPKKEVLALFLRRKEYEVIVLDRTRLLPRGTIGTKKEIDVA